MADRNKHLANDYPHQSFSSSDTAPPSRPAALWNNSNPPLPRGRAPRDPNARSAKYSCNSIEELESALSSYLESLPSSPEHSSCEITLWASASLMTTESLPPAAINNSANPLEYNPKTVLEALEATPDIKDTMKKQRAVSKICVAAVQRVDGYRYSFHNNWKSGEENAFRFSYYCNDSLLNKDRVANGKAGSEGRRPTKPVYDCKGVLSIKFSATRQCIDVIYKHIPCHPTYEERAPTPRRESKRRASWERTNHERVRKSIAQPEPEESDRAPKRPRKIEATPNTSVESDLRQESLKSLLTLIRTDNEDPNRSAEAKDKPNGTEVRSTAQEIVPNGNLTQPPPTVNQICEICMHRRARCDGIKPKCGPCTTKSWPCWYMKPNDNFRNSGPSKVSVEPPNTDSQLVKEKRQSEKLQKERDQAQQALKSAKDENDKLQKTIKDFEERFKRLEAQLHEKAPAPPSIPQASAIPQNQTNTSYQPHQISQAARMNPTYSTHGAERALNHGQTYPTQMTATAAGHAGRGQMYHNANQPMVPRWPNAPFMGYQPPTDNNIWNTTHMPPQLR